MPIEQAVWGYVSEGTDDILAVMPERSPGESPKEAKARPFYRSAAYPNEATSEQPYDTLKRTIFTEPCDLSAYRIQLLPNRAYHVIALGLTPPPELQRRIEDILATGTTSVLPDEIIAQLVLRRIEQTQAGGWVEKSYSPRRGRRLK